MADAGALSEHQHHHHQSHSSWSLPLAAWQLIVQRLQPEDALTARLVCSCWRQDLAAFVPTAKAVPSDLLSQPSSHAAVVVGQQLLQAFPHCHSIDVDISSSQQQHLAAALLNSLFSANRNSSSSGSRQRAAAAAAPAEDETAVGVGGLLPRGRSPRVCLDAVPRSFHCKARQDYPRTPAGTSAAVFQLLTQLPRQLQPPSLSLLTSLTLDAFPDSPDAWLLLRAALPCLQELLLPPFKPALPHEHLPALAQLTQLTALELSVQGSVTSWRACCESFSAVQALTRLQRLTLHAFHCPGRSLAAGLSALLRLTSLRLSGRVVLAPLQQSLACLTRLRVLELTQDVQYGALCELQQSLPHLTQLAVGRVTLPPHQQAPAAAPAVAAAAAMAAAEMGQWPLPGAPEPAAAAAAVPADAAGGDGAAEAEQPQQQAVAVPPPGLQHNQLVPPLPLAAAIPPIPPPPIPAAAAAGGGGEVMLEDVGLIVDGLVGNLQEGAIPLHLQRIIERFESIIQLDLTRRASSSSPWTWPTGGLALVQAASGLHTCWQQQQGREEEEEEAEAGSQQQACCEAAGGSSKGAASSSSSGDAKSWERSGAAAGAGSSRFSSSSGALSSLELALLKPADVARLADLPAEMRATQHLGLRLRDQLLAFASVCALKLEPGQLAPLGHTFDNLLSLSLSGKVSMSGQLFRELTASLGGSSSSASSGISSSSAIIQPRVLQSLCLDLHFVGVAADDVAAALGALPHLKALSLRHRGAGKLVVPVSALPPSLTVLALKKAMLLVTSRRGSSSSDGSSGSSPGTADACSMRPCTPPPQQQQLSVQVEAGGGGAGGSELSHAITSPGFNRAVLTGSISSPDLPALIIMQSPAAVTALQPAATAGTGCCPCCCGSNWAGTEATTATVAAAVAAGGDSSSSSSPAWVCRGQQQPLLPHLRQLYLKLCFVPAAAMDALLGLPCPHARYQQHKQQQALLRLKRQQHWRKQQRQHRGGLAAELDAGSGAPPLCGGAFAALPPPAGSSGGAAGPQHQSCLEVLSVTGDSSTPGEQSEAWLRWLQALQHLPALQVLELAVPDQLRCSVPLSLLTTLHRLPRLAHLHLTTSAAPHQLATLASLRGPLRTLSVSYTGPPALPAGLLDSLQQGLGPYCRVQLWEQIALLQHGSFDSAADGSSGAGGVAAEGQQQSLMVGAGAASEAGQSAAAAAGSGFHSVWVAGGEGREGPWVCRVGGHPLPDGSWGWAESECPRRPRVTERLRGWLCRGGSSRGSRLLRRAVLHAGALGTRAAHGVLVFEAGRQLGRLAGSCRHRSRGGC